MAKYHDLNNVAQHLVLMAIRDSDWPEIGSGVNKEISIFIGDHELDFNYFAESIEEHFDLSVEKRAKELSEVTTVKENEKMSTLSRKLYDLKTHIDSLSFEVNAAIEELYEPIDHLDDYD